MCREGEEAAEGLARARKCKDSKTYTEVEGVSPGRNLAWPGRKDCLRLGDDEFSEGVDYIMSLFEFPHVTLHGTLATGDRLAQCPRVQSGAGLPGFKSPFYHLAL